MNEVLFNNTKLAAYFLWEYTDCDNALDLWRCAEDIAMYFERNGLGLRQVAEIKGLDVTDAAYIGFVRHIAFRIYVYTNRKDPLANWYTTKRLLASDEWIHALTEMASVYRSEKSNRETMDCVRSENVRAYYNAQTLPVS